jgi:riboflavin transporter FmnP
MENLGANPRKYGRVLSVKALTTSALLGVLAYLCMLVRFPLPFMPPFMDFDIAGVAEAIGCFLNGPAAGVFIVAVKLLIKLATNGSASAFTGELINFMLSCSFIIPAWFVYSRGKNLRRAALGLAAGTLAATVVACVANVYLIIPLYAKLYGFDMNAVIAMTRAVNKYVDSVPKLVLLGIMPFNLIKWGVSSAVVCALHDRVARARGLM